MIALLDYFSFSFIQFSGYRAIQTDGLFCYPQVQPSEAARFNPRRFFVVLSSIQLPQRGRDPLKRANKRCMPRPLCCSLMAVCGRWVRAHWRRTARLELRAIENPPEIPRYGPRWGRGWVVPYLGIPGLCGPPGAPAAPVLKTRSPVPEPPAASTGRELSGAESLAEDPEAFLLMKALALVPGPGSRL